MMKSTLSSRTVFATHFIVALGSFVVLAFSTQGQDVGWLVDSAPGISMIVVKALDKCPTFTAGVEVKVSGKMDPQSSSASGGIESRIGSLRWDVKLANIQATQLSSSARAIVQQINGDQFTLLTRPDQHASYLVLAGAQSYLSQSLPSMQWLSRGPPVNDSIEGVACVKAHFVAALATGNRSQVIVWKTKEQLPLKIEMADEGELIQIRFKDVHFRSLARERFDLPANLSKYSSMEDLIQSVLVDKIRRRFGLEK